MNIPNEARIWRDSCDRDLFHIGVKLTRVRNCQWSSIPLCGIGYCFGDEAQRQAQKLKPGKPVPLKDVLDAPGNDTGKRLDKVGEGR
jgi:hypothetical protein